MKEPAGRNLPASVRERLYRLAARRNEDFALILTRFVGIIVFRFRIADDPDRMSKFHKSALKPRFN